MKAALPLAERIATTLCHKLEGRAYSPLDIRISLHGVLTGNIVPHTGEAHTASHAHTIHQATVALLQKRHKNTTDFRRSRHVDVERVDEVLTCQELHRTSDPSDASVIDNAPELYKQRSLNEPCIRFTWLGLKFWQPFIIGMHYRKPANRNIARS